MKLAHRGFTLVELSFSMTFVSVLLLAIVVAAIHAGNIYNKGLVMESVNQAGRDIGDTIRRDFLQMNTSAAFAGLSNPVIRSDASARMCLGGYAYIWNTPQAVSGDAIEDDLVVTQNSQPISLVRVVDRGDTLCAPKTNGAYVYNLDELGSGAQITHLLKRASDGSVGLAIYDLIVQPVTVSGSEGLFSISYTIGTGAVSEIDSSRCKPPSDVESNDSFCAINQFETIVRSNG